MGNPNREKLLARKAALEAEQEAIRAKLRAAQSRLSAQDRKEDIRRKILLGSFYLARTKLDDRANAAMLKDMNGYLTREDDRKLFGLPPLLERPTGDVPETANDQPSDSPPPMMEKAQRAVAH